MFTEVISASAIRRDSDEDLCSQMNYVWTALILSAMGLMITLFQYVGDPIHCLCPAQLTEAQCNYTKALCWIKHNYFVHKDSPIQHLEEDRYELTVAYYPWVPWILFAMAAMLNVPNILWSALAPTSGLDLKKFIAKASTHETLDNLGKILVLWLGRRRPQHRQSDIVSSAERAAGSWGLFWFGKHQRSYLCGLLLLTKLGYMVASIGEFFLINSVFILSDDSLLYGWDVVRNFLFGTVNEMPRFPVYTICDIKIRQLYNVHAYSFQCILPINMYNQKIFLFLWFWLIMLSTINIYSFFKWALHLLSPANRRHFVKTYVRLLYYISKGRRVGGGGWGEDSRSGTENSSQDGRGEESPGRDETERVPDGASANVTRRRTPSSTSTRPRAGSTAPNSRPRSHGHCSIEERPGVREEMKEDKRNINTITAKMIDQFGHDGVVVFRILENAVGVVIANRIFQELYEQLEGKLQ